MYRKVGPAAKIIPPDDNEFLSGSVRLLFNRGTAGRKIKGLANSLSKYPEVQTVSTSYFDRKGSSVALFIPKPMPLYQVLYKIAGVHQVASEDDGIQITIREDCPSSLSPTHQRFSLMNWHSVWSKVSCHFGN
jgi:hypothetical protein